MQIDNMTFRRFLIWIKKQTNTNIKNFYFTYGGIFILSLGMSLALDYFTPFDGFWMILRTLTLVPLSVTIFILVYSWLYILHLKKVKKDPEWTSFRGRLSPAWRRRVGIITAAVLLVVVYSSQQIVGYTFVSSCVVAAVIGIFAFIRKTTSEQKRADLGIEDYRDVEYSSLIKKMEKEQSDKKDSKKQKRSQKRYEKWGYKDKNYVDPDDAEVAEKLVKKKKSKKKKSK